MLKDLFVIVTGYGPHDTDPGHCWGVKVSEPKEATQAFLEMDELYESSLVDNPDAQYFWAMMLPPGHPLITQFPKE